MNKITLEALRPLLDHSGGDVISIYLPTHRVSTPPTTQEDRTRFKNLVREAAEKRDRLAGKRALARAFRDMDELLDDEDFWATTTEGLAVFAGEGGAKVFHMPVGCEPSVYAAKTYDLAPALAVAAMNEPFYLLVLALHSPKLLRGDMYELEPVAAELPVSPEEALNIDEMFSDSQTVKGQSGPGAASPHGEGDSGEAGREERLKYFRIIEQALADSEGFDINLPLLVAGTDSNAGDFRARARLQSVMKGAYLAGNHTETPLPELHGRAWECIYETCVLPKWRTAAERFNAKIGTGLAADDIDEIAGAAGEGRVDALILPLVYQTEDSAGGGALEAAMMVKNPDVSEAGLETLRRAVADTARQGGTVLGVEPALTGESRRAAAIYRY